MAANKWPRDIGNSARAFGGVRSNRRMGAYRRLIRRHPRPFKRGIRLAAPGEHNPTIPPNPAGASYRPVLEASGHDERSLVSVDLTNGPQRQGSARATL